PYFSMEHVDGANLIEKYPEKPVSPPDAAVLMATAAAAMQYAHEQGVLHCALKPSNILLTRGGIPKITNFGLAVLLEREQGGHFRKKVYHRLASSTAPELALGKFKEVGPAADTYALGAILYKLLTGNPPFLADTVQKTLEQVCNQEPKPPSQCGHKVPRDL